MQQLLSLLKIFYRAGYNLVHNDGLELSGYLTFLTLLGLFPFLVILVAGAGFIGQGEAGAQFITLLITHLPAEVVQAVKPRIEEIISGPPQGLLTVAILGALWTSSSMVEGLRTVLNRAYKVSDPPIYIVRRLISMLQVIVFVVVIIVVMAVLLLTPLAFGMLEAKTGMRIPLEIQQFFSEDFIYLGGGLILAGVASLYYWLPNIKQSLVHVVPGAALVVVLWVAGAGIVTYYLDHVGTVNIIYGSLSGFIATLVFFYVMNLIFIYGAECNYQLKLSLGIKVEEREHSPISSDTQVIRNDKK